MVFQMKLFIYKYIPLFLSLFYIPFASYAGWYQAEGVANIGNGIEYARQKAIENALAQIELHSGARISGKVTIQDGRIISEQLNLASEQRSEVHNVQLISEKKQGETLSVVLRAQIFSGASCETTSSVINQLAIAKLRLKNRQHASYGAIYALDKAATQQLFQQLQTNPKLSVKLIQDTIGFSPDMLHTNPETASLIRDLSDRTQSRYILLGYIDDLSVDEQQATPSWQLWKPQSVPRNLSLHLYLLDGLTGDLLNHAHYQSQAPWNQKRNYISDPNSQQFWRSEYGQEWHRQLLHAATDISNQLHCQPAISRIIAIHDQQYVVPLGRLDGIQSGQIAYLSRRQQFVDTLGQVSTLFETTSVKLKVTSSGPHQSLLTPVDPTVAGNIQVQDAVIF